MNNDFRVTVGLKNRTLSFQTMPNLVRIYQIAVVRDGHHAFVRLDQYRLSIEQCRVARGRITCVPDGECSAQTREHLFGEDVGDQSHGFVGVQGHSI